ncbi:hypothetical protein [Sphingobacterium pedocola]|uniref:HTH cro/C1-type domain-containing protein n=1 Tax=Sphingobacterium pedocola TaxID=2082722 RepID=A0ABR9T486_9SPHI|nr:hypothetical protein [Sphingobacterium pedocola]MBE8720166.1 hypothetical protein [Sphingobacterium pedocola]
MSSVLKRIKVISDHEGISVTALEAAIGASKGVFSRALANGTDIQSKWLVKIIENYPQYSSEWLLSGKGEMLREAATTARDKTDHYEESAESHAVINALKMVISTQEKTIQSLDKQVLFLEEQVQKLKGK